MCNQVQLACCTPSVSELVVFMCMDNFYVELVKFCNGNVNRGESEDCCMPQLNFFLFQSAMEGLVQLVKVGVRPQDLPEFFWHHLERDMELLGSAIGKSMDESAIIVHLVLREILLKDPPTCEN